MPKREDAKRDGQKREGEKRPGLIDRAVDRFDLPGEVLSDLPRITVTGSQRVVVENHKGLMDYGEHAIVVGGGKVTVKIVGDDLELRAMNAQELLITGNVFNVEFEY